MEYFAIHVILFKNFTFSFTIELNILNLIEIERIENLQNTFSIPTKLLEFEKFIEFVFEFSLIFNNLIICVEKN